MRIAILGANSELAKDLVVNWSHLSDDTYELFSRRPDETAFWIRSTHLIDRARSRRYDELELVPSLDVLINFVGAGNPIKVSNMGTDIIRVTLAFDRIALNYLATHRDCRYIFISSGAVFGTDFEHPVSRSTKALVPVNDLGASDWYSIAKLIAECRHRKLIDTAIVDIRVFNYFSHTQDMSAAFLMADIARCIRSGKVLQTRNYNIVRDYIAPTDFAKLIKSVVSSSSANTAIDCYSREPVDKFTLLNRMRTAFGLEYEVKSDDNDTESKLKRNYFSVNRHAADFGYIPQYSSLESIEREITLLQ